MNACPFTYFFSRQFPFCGARGMYWKAVQPQLVADFDIVIILKDINSVETLHGDAALQAMNKTWLRHNGWRTTQHRLSAVSQEASQM